MSTRPPDWRPSDLLDLLAYIVDDGWRTYRFSLLMVIPLTTLILITLILSGSNYAGLLSILGAVSATVVYVMVPLVRLLRHRRAAQPDDSLPEPSDPDRGITERPINDDIERHGRLIARLVNNIRRRRQELPPKADQAGGDASLTGGDS